MRFFFYGCKLSSAELETKEIIAIILEFRCTIQLVIEADGSDNQCQNVECPIIDGVDPYACRIANCSYVYYNNIRLLTKLNRRPDICCCFIYATEIRFTIRMG